MYIINVSHLVRTEHGPDFEKSELAFNTKREADKALKDKPGGWNTDKSAKVYFTRKKWIEEDTGEEYQEYYKWSIPTKR